MLVEVPILVDRDFLVASSANLVSLAPGTFVLHIDRPQRCYYVYSLGGHPPDVDSVVRGSIKMQLRVVKAFGTAEEIRSVVERVQQLGEAPSRAGDGT